MCVIFVKVQLTIKKREDVGRCPILMGFGIFESHNMPKHRSNSQSVFLTSFGREWIAKLVDRIELRFALELLGTEEE